LNYILVKILLLQNFEMPLVHLIFAAIACEI